MRSRLILALMSTILFLSGCAVQMTENQELEGPPSAKPELVAENLDIPWEIRSLPDGDILVTERPGTLLHISEDSEERIEVEGVRHVGEGGLLGMALHPDFEQNRWLYLYMTTEAEEGTSNRVERYTYSSEKSLSNRTTIITGIPGARYHDGGRIEFGPDRYLYITTGDAGDAADAQDRDSLAGKILRIKDDGSIPEDNPFGTAVYSFGHRNPQGLAWDSEGRLWSTEHGRSGIRSGFDELNLIENGKNYGWPIMQGSEKQESMVLPIVHSGPDYTWAPASAAHWNGSIFFGGLRGSALYEIRIDDTDTIIRHLEGQYGRIRAVRLGHDGHLYFSTSNTDGRGRPYEGDDKILRIDPKKLKR